MTATDGGELRVLLMSSFSSADDQVGLSGWGKGDRSGLEFMPSKLSDGGGS